MFRATPNSNLKLHLCSHCGQGSLPTVQPYDELVADGKVAMREPGIGSHLVWTIAKDLVGDAGNGCGKWFGLRNKSLARLIILTHSNRRTLQTRPFSTDLEIQGDPFHIHKGIL